MALKSIQETAIRACRLLFRDVVFTMRGGLAKGLKRRFGLGFKPKFGLTKEEKFLLGLDFRGKTIYDIGGYIGIYTLFFSRAAGENGKVVAFEPMPENFGELSFNIGINGIKNATALNLAVGREKSRVKMVVPSYTSRGSLDTGVQEKIRCTCNAMEIIVEVDSIDSLTKG
ncbi:Uncharacterised protein [uncultured archaeon]|nr:Uncharacterised protein [uncultured archaeon]